MARKDALLKLHARLQARRRELLDAIQEDLGDLRQENGHQGGRDEADAATDSMSAEMTSQLAELESRELAQIDRALARLLNGVYGTCEICNKKIPVARLNALPYTALCIDCQRQCEANPEIADEDGAGWQKVFDAESAARDVSVNLSDLELNLS